MMKILIADDHTIVRRGLKEIISEEYRGDVVFGEANTAFEVLNAVWNQDWDVVVLDITMPGKSGIDVLKELKQLRPKLPVLVLSIHPEGQYAVRALKVGASGYLTKESAPTELLNAISKVVEGGKYVSPSLAERLAWILGDDSDQPVHERLSDREYQVMRMIAQGKTLKEIGEQLSLSVKTISTYRSRLLEKMHMKRNAELTRYAIQHQLID